MKTVNLDYAQHNLPMLAAQLVDETEVALIARDDGPAMVLMPLDRYMNLMGTAHLPGSPPNGAHAGRFDAEPDLHG